MSFARQLVHFAFFATCSKEKRNPAESRSQRFSDFSGLAVCFLLKQLPMATTQTEELQNHLLSAALSFLEQSGGAAQSILVPLPGGRKLGIEVELFQPSEGGKIRESERSLAQVGSGS